MSGSRPIATNSVVPIAKPPRARANTASQRTVGGGRTTESGADGRSRILVTADNGNETYAVRRIDLGISRYKSGVAYVLGVRIGMRPTVGDVFALIREHVTSLAPTSAS